MGVGNVDVGLTRADVQELGKVFSLSYCYPVLY